VESEVRIIMLAQLNIRKFLETLVKIIGDREGLEITVVAIRKRESEKSA